jgi:hypothetical protein
MNTAARTELLVAGSWFLRALVVRPWCVCASGVSSRKESIMLKDPNIETWVSYLDVEGGGGFDPGSYFTPSSRKDEHERQARLRARCDALKGQMPRLPVQTIKDGASQTIAYVPVYDRGGTSKTQADQPSGMGGSLQGSFFSFPAKPLHSVGKYGRLMSCTPVGHTEAVAAVQRTSSALPELRQQQNPVNQADSGHASRTQHANKPIH